MSGAATGRIDTHLQSLLSMPADAKPNLAGLNLRVLSPYQRALLVIDGTVTKFIEAYMLEPVTIHRLYQEPLTLPSDHQWLEVSAGTEVLLREVSIVGRNSGNLYVYAVSLVVPNRLPAIVRERLETQGAGIGRVLNELRLETRREVLWYAQECSPARSSEGEREEKRDFFTRAYKIVHNDVPIALIHEKFPAEIDPLPAHH